MEAADAEEPGGFDRWRKESALGAVGTGVARGLQAVFAPRVDEIVVMVSVPGEPPDADQRLQVILDPDDPTKSVAIVPATAGGAAVRVVVQRRRCRAGVQSVFAVSSPRRAPRPPSIAYASHGSNHATDDAGVPLTWALR